VHHRCAVGSRRTHTAGQGGGRVPSRCRQDMSGQKQEHTGTCPRLAARRSAARAAAWPPCRRRPPRCGRQTPRRSCTAAGCRRYLLTALVWGSPVLLLRRCPPAGCSLVTPAAEWAAGNTDPRNGPGHLPSSMPLSVIDKDSHGDSAAVCSLSQPVCADAAKHHKTLFGTAQG
jgi:hypothetical protein